MNRRFKQWAFGLVVLGIALAGLAESMFVVGPGERVLMERGGKIVAGPLQPGLHWKIPLAERTVRLPGHVTLLRGQVRAGANGQGFTAGYALAWSISDVRRFYSATGGDGSDASQKLSAAADDVVRKAMASAGAKRFLAEPVASVNAALAAAVSQPAGKLGVHVVDAELTGVDVPAALQQRLAGRMAAEGTAASPAAASAAYAAKTLDIRRRAASLLAGARHEAATIRGHTDATIAGIYAQAGKAAPGFFRFYRALESEKAALRENTRVLVISTDSPWFHALRAGGGQGSHG